MALDVGDRVAWLGRAEKAVVLRHVQAIEAGGGRLPDKLIRGFRAMLVVLRHHPPSVQTTLYYLRAVRNSGDRLPGDAPPVLERAAGGGGGRSAEAHQRV